MGVAFYLHISIFKMTHTRYRMDIIRESPDSILLDVNTWWSSDSREPLATPAECLSRLLLTEDLADLNLILPNVETPLKVHRLVLAMWSPVFKAMFFGPMPEGDSVSLPEDPPEAFKWMLDYMYSGCTQLPNVDLAVNVYMLSNKYQMDHLKAICSKFLMNSVTAVSVPEVMNVATLLVDDSLKSKCTEILDTSPDNVFLSPSVGSFSSESLQQLLSLEIPISSETIIFQGLLTWGRSQLKLRDEEISSTNLRQEIEKFLPQIRFLTMTLEEFVKNVLPEYILTLEESTPIQQILVGVQGINIPKTCSDIRTTRIKFHISQLQTCKLSYATRTLAEGTQSFSAGDERELLSAIKCRKEIHISKLEYVSNIGDSGELIVRDTKGDIDNIEFNGHVALFKNRLKMIPGQAYSFVLKGCARTLCKFTYSINTNENITGNMRNNYTTSIILHYWK